MTDNDDMMVDDFSEYEQHSIIGFTIADSCYALNTIYGSVVIVDFDKNSDYKIFRCENNTKQMVEKCVVFTSDNSNTIKLVYDNYILMNGEYFAEKHHFERRFSAI